jgi:transcriptional regulator with XRE-family HTH domain
LHVDIGDRLRKIRERHGLSQRALAKKANVTNGLISMSEQNRTSPSVATLKKILDSINFSLADFFTFDLFDAKKIVYTRDDLVEIGSGGFSYRQIGADLSGMAMQILHERINPGADTGEEMISHKAEEAGVVVSGTIELTVEETTYVLGIGDAYYFDSRLPHRFRNCGEQVCEIVSACTPPSF